MKPQSLRVVHCTAAVTRALASRSPHSVRGERQRQDRSAGVGTTAAQWGRAAASPRPRLCVHLLQSAAQTNTGPAGLHRGPSTGDSRMLCRPGQREGPLHPRSDVCCRSRLRSAHPDPPRHHAGALPPSSGNPKLLPFDSLCSVWFSGYSLMEV